MQNHPAAFARISGWVTHVSGPVDERPDVGHRGAFGTGNGHTFGLIGLADPLNTLHSLVGPTYERHDKFFGDYAIKLVVAGGDGSAAQFDEEWATRSLSSPAVLTRRRLGDLWLDTVDFAPSSDDPLLNKCFIRILTVRNLGTSASAAHELQVRPINPVSEAAPGVLLETTESKALTTAFTKAGASVDEQVLSLAVGPLDPGAEQQQILVHCSALGAATVTLPTIDAGELLDETAAAYQAWDAGLVQVELPDPMVADFVDGMKITLKSQTAATGASCPMSQYTRTWARDNIGPTLALLSLGAHDDVRAMMDYVYGAILLKGDLNNSYDADLDVSDLPAAPDWDGLPVLTERVAAETPSYRSSISISETVLRAAGVLRSTGRSLPESPWKLTQQLSIEWGDYVEMIAEG